MRKATVVFKRFRPTLSPDPQVLHPKTSCRFLRFLRQKPTFSLRKTYGSAPGNVRFPIGKHRKCKDIFPIIDQRLNKKGRKPPDSQPSTYRHQYKPNPPASQIAIPRQKASTAVRFLARRSHASYEIRQEAPLRQTYLPDLLGLKGA